ncbi:hypothetical protein HDV00_001996 [Rhizophlyctis rosea]|nr:hypothetical protein HDV00_001996 [Rhizophlyctis rosea]
MRFDLATAEMHEQHAKAMRPFLNMKQADAIGEITLLVGAEPDDETSYKVNGDILRCRSPFYQSMFSSAQWKETATRTVNLPEMSPDAVKIAVEYIYTGFLSLDLPEIPTDLVNATKQILDLQTVLAYFLIAPERDNPLIRNLRDRMLSHKKNAEGLTQCWKMIQKSNFKEYVDMAIDIFVGTGLGTEVTARIASATADVRVVCRITRKKWPDKRKNVSPIQKVLKGWYDSFGNSDEGDGGVAFNDASSSDSDD